MVTIMGEQVLKNYNTKIKIFKFDFVMHFSLIVIWFPNKNQQIYFNAFNLKQNLKQKQNNKNPTILFAFFNDCDSAGNHGNHGNPGFHMVHHIQKKKYQPNNPCGMTTH